MGNILCAQFMRTIYTENLSEFNYTFGPMTKNELV